MYTPEQVREIISTCDVYPRTILVRDFNAFVSELRNELQELIDGRSPSYDVLAARLSLLRAQKDVRMAVCLEGANDVVRSLEPYLPLHVDQYWFEVQINNKTIIDPALVIQELRYRVIAYVMQFVGSHLDYQKIFQCDPETYDSNINMIAKVVRDHFED